MADPLRIAVVGGRGFGQVHLAGLYQLRERGLDIEYYPYSSSPSEAKAVAERFGAAGYFTSYQDVLNSNVDVVDLVVSHDAHAPMSIQAMRAGKHVLLEKPIARDMDEATSIVREAERAGVKFMVAENYHFNATFEALYEAARGLGRLHTIIVRDTHFNQPTGWRTVRSRMGGGAVIDGGIHMMHVMLNVGGPYRRACGLTYNTGVVRMEGEDVGVALIEFESGARGVYMYGWAFRGAPPAPVIEVYGEGGGIYEDPSSRVVKEVRGVRYLARHGDLVVNGERVRVRDGDMIVEELEGFIRSVETGAPVPMPTELELRDLRAILDIYSTPC